MVPFRLGSVRPNEKEWPASRFDVCVCVTNVWAVVRCEPGAVIGRNQGHGWIVFNYFLAEIDHCLPGGSGCLP